jgi:hypothetical protein
MGRLKPEEYGHGGKVTRCVLFVPWFFQDFSVVLGAFQKFNMGSLKACLNGKDSMKHSPPVGYIQLEIKK